MKPNIQEVADKYVAFKAFRAARYAKNMLGDKVKEAQEAVSAKYDEMYPDGKSTSMLWWDSHRFDMYQTSFNLLIRLREYAANEGIPPESFEGMLEWIAEGEPVE